MSALAAWRKPYTQAHCAAFFGVGLRTWKHYEATQPPRWLEILCQSWDSLDAFLGARKA